MLSWLPSAPWMLCKRSPCWPGSSLIREVLGLAGAWARTASLSSSSSAAFLGVHHHRLSPGVSQLLATGGFFSRPQGPHSQRVSSSPSLPHPTLLLSQSLSAEGARIHPATHARNQRAIFSSFPPDPTPSCISKAATKPQSSQTIRAPSLLCLQLPGQALYKAPAQGLSHAISMGPGRQVCLENLS